MNIPLQFLPLGKQGSDEEPLDWARNLWHVNFMGIRTIQFHVDFLVWERVLEQLNPQRIIELGSGNGGFTLYLHMQAIQRGALFTSFDHVVPFTVDLPLGKLLGTYARCIAGDLWDGPQRTSLVVSQLIEESDRSDPRPVILFCDNGNKPLEFRTFAPQLHPGDVIAVHDWDNEFSPLDITDDLKEITEPYMWSEVEAMGSLTRFWRRK
jgi:cephalosporin hydroxylase